MLLEQITEVLFATLDRYLKMKKLSKSKDMAKHRFPKLNRSNIYEKST